MRKIKLIILLIISVVFVSCTSSRLVSYKPNKDCSTYNDLTPLSKRHDIPKSLRSDYRKYK